MIWSALAADASIVRGHVDLAGVFDVDLHAGLLDDAADHLAAGPDQVADLVGRNLQGVDSAARRHEIFSRGVGDDLVHLVEDVAAVRAAPAPALRA